MTRRIPAGDMAAPPAPHAPDHAPRAREDFSPLGRVSTRHQAFNLQPNLDRSCSPRHSVSSPRSRRVETRPTATPGTAPEVKRQVIVLYKALADATFVCVEAGDLHGGSQARPTTASQPTRPFAAYVSERSPHFGPPPAHSWRKAQRCRPPPSASACFPCKRRAASSQVANGSVAN